MLLGRRIHLCLEDCSSMSRLVRKGLIQGFVLSPILYNIYNTYDLEAAFKGKIRILHYADYLLLYVPDKIIQYYNIQLYWALNSLVFLTVNILRLNVCVIRIF